MGSVPNIPTAAAGNGAAIDRSRNRNIIVTGLNVHSYAHAATRTRSTRGSTQTDREYVNESNEMRTIFVKFAQDKLNVSVEEIDDHGHPRPAETQGWHKPCHRPTVVR